MSNKNPFGRPVKTPIGQSFEAWMKIVNSAVQEELGLSTEHFPDRNHRDAFDCGIKPLDWVEDCVEQWG